MNLFDTIAKLMSEHDFTVVPTPKKDTPPTIVVSGIPVPTVEDVKRTFVARKVDDDLTRATDAELAQERAEKTRRVAKAVKTLSADRERALNLAASRGENPRAAFESKLAAAREYDATHPRRTTKTGSWWLNAPREDFTDQAKGKK